MFLQPLAREPPAPAQIPTSHYRQACALLGGPVGKPPLCQQLAPLALPGMGDGRHRLSGSVSHRAPSSERCPFGGVLPLTQLRDVTVFKEQLPSPQCGASFRL